MYTGIVQSLVPVVSLIKKPGLTTFSVEMDQRLQANLETGASVAVNGCCFTVTKLKGDEVFFDAIAETLALTNIKYLEVGSLVNIERSAHAHAEVGGHILSGHVIGTATVITIERTPNNCRMTFEGQADWLKYVFNKGFLAVNGCSLTIADIDQARHQFSINLIPETLQRTNFALLKEGDEVNIEIESQTQVIVDTVERVMAQRYSA